MSVLSLGLLLPFGAGAFPDRAITVLRSAAAETPTKHITFIHGVSRETVETRAVTADAFLLERGIIRQPDDRVEAPPDSNLIDGSTVAYQPVRNVRVVVDGAAQIVRSSATTVGQLLAEAHLPVTHHDRVTPVGNTPLEPDAVVTVTHVRSWLERVRSAIAPPIARKFDIAMLPGTQRVVDPGAPGTKETTVAVHQPNEAAAPQRTFLAARVLRLPRTRVVAEGVGDGATFGQIAHRGFVSTLRLADAALRMVATAYTAGCSGCSGITATGAPAGHGIVAVDPRIIPLGSHLYIPGYGHALAGDTGGAIRGNRIDLGFDTHRDALIFGRRPIVVYVFK